MKKHYLLILLLLIFPVSVFAADFGLVINAGGGLESGVEGENTVNYKLDILPRLSSLMGSNGEFIISAGFSAGNEEGFRYVPEILRTEVSLRFGNSGIKFGRVNYYDPLSFIAVGLFDGVQYYHNSNVGTLNIGAYYTGLLYKRRADIIMTKTDEVGISVPFDFGDFSNTYFASKRVFAAVGWEHPSLGEFMHLNTALIGQADLNKEDNKYNSEYIIIKAGIPINKFLIELGGSVEFAQVSVDNAGDNDSQSNISFAGDFGLSLLFPSQFNSMLSLKGTIAGGKNDEDTSGAFTPITAKEYGYILKTKISGLSVFSLNYSSRFNNFFSGSLTASYFVRNDLGTYSGYPISAGSEGYFLGLEPSIQIIWSPASDLQFNLGGGVFLPSAGDAGSQEKIMWRFDLTLVMSVL